MTHKLLSILFAVPLLADPRKAPLLPHAVVSTVARFCFNVLTIPLIFSTIASSVTIDSIGDYWFVLVGAVGVLAISFAVATVLGWILPIANKADFQALRIAATFPNIVALPILIFPSLCEYEVVYQAFGGRTTTSGDDDGSGEDRAELYRQCVAKSNTMIFCYFFGWSLMFWSFGHPILMTAARAKHQQCEEETEQEQPSTDDLTVADTDMNTAVEENSAAVIPPREKPTMLSNIKRAIWQTFASPPFLAMILAFAVGCISPIRNLLFSPGGHLRFLGAAVETLGQASSPLSTMVVAASLASRQKDPTSPNPDDDAVNDGNSGSSPTDEEEPHQIDNRELESDNNTTPNSIEEESPVMSDPNFGPLHLRRRSSVQQRFRASLRRSSMKALEKARRTPPEQRRLYLWFTLSNLILSPTLVVLAIVGLDCSGVLASSGVPALAKLVLIVNSSVPGALIVVVLLKSNPDLHETAAVVAKVYFPTYILSIVTIAAWTALGLIVSIPDDEGNSFCAQWQ